MRITPIERNLKKVVSAAVKSAAAAESKLQKARETRYEIEKAVKRAQRAAAREQTAAAQKAYTRELQKLQKARGIVSERRAAATATRKAKRTAETQLLRYQKSDTNPYTGERYQHIFPEININDIGIMVSQSEFLAESKKREIMRTMKKKIANRIQSLRTTQKQYGTEIPVSDAVQEYEQGIKNLSPSNPDNFETIILFYNKLFLSNEFESGTIKDYRAFIEGINEQTEQLADSGFTTQEIKDFYRVLNLVKKYFPDYYDDSETRKQIKLRLDSGMSWDDVYNSLKSWWGTEQAEQDRIQSQRNIAERKKMQEQAKQAKFKQKQREIMEKRKKKRG